MTQQKSIFNFFEKECGKNDDYSFNKCHPNRQEVRDYCSKLYEHYVPYCPDDIDHFLKDAVENTQQRWWEMYLAWILFKIAKFEYYKVQKGQGPDFCVKLPAKRKVWVEAIAVRPGVGENEVKRPVAGQVGILPVNQMILRVTSAFAEKVKNIKCYRKKRIIALEDAVIIAINTGEMRDSDLADENQSLAGEALCGYGRQTIKKNQDVMISTDSLLTNRIVSGVFFSTKHFIDMVDSGKDLKILLNPKAQNPLEKNVFNFGTIMALPEVLRERY